MSNPLVSIIIPCFNSASYIERCIDSLNKLDYNNLEVIIVDDASLDNTYELILSLKVNFELTVLKNKFNIGTFHSRKKGFLASSGEKIIFLDPDDELKPEAVRNLVNFSLKNKIDYLFFLFEVRPAQVIPFGYPEISEYPKSIFEAILKPKIIAKSNGGKLIDRDLLYSVYEFLYFVNKRFIFTEDVIIFFACLIFAKKIGTLKEELYIYNIDMYSITKNKDNVDFKCSQMRYCIECLDFSFEKKNDPVIRNAYLKLKENLEKELIYLSRFSENSEKFKYLKTCLLIFFRYYDFKYILKFLCYILTFGKKKF